MAVGAAGYITVAPLVLSASGDTPKLVQVASVCGCVIKRELAGKRVDREAREPLGAHKGPLRCVLIQMYVEFLMPVLPDKAIQPVLKHPQPLCLKTQLLNVPENWEINSPYLPREECSPVAITIPYFISLFGYAGHDDKRKLATKVPVVNVSLKRKHRVIEDEVVIPR
ncbi:hypothetical protein B0H66DRAFT_530895 [Apodospora peruviana]|uniref:Uncharacterized protein n=1 Tax=Apodospora peruviana TaxID=516989 RepID=A0AAE0ILC8_9PEZI|nr:hypothetical protein B0H66DRAFT_530895 [Apodospora peruviana]